MYSQAASVLQVNTLDFGCRQNDLNKGARRQGASNARFLRPIVPVRPNPFVPDHIRIRFLAHICEKYLSLENAGFVRAGHFQAFIQDFQASAGLLLDIGAFRGRDGSYDTAVFDTTVTALGISLEAVDLHFFGSFRVSRQHSAGRRIC